MAAEEDKAPRTVKLKKCNPLLEKRIHVTIAAIDDNPPTAFFNNLVLYMEFQRRSAFNAGNFFILDSSSHADLTHYLLVMNDFDYVRGFL